MLTPAEKEKVDKSVLINVIGVDGKKMPLLGVMECKFTILNQKINHTVKVMEDNTHECILGMDILSRIKGLTFVLHTEALAIGPIKRRCNQMLEEMAIIDATITILPDRCIVSVIIFDPLTFATL